MLRFTANLSLLFTEVALPERFRAARQSGFDAVEIQFPYTLSAAESAASLQENRLKLVLFNVDADDLLQGGEGLAAVPEKRLQFREALQQAVAYAAILRPEAVNILPGRCLDNNRYDAYRRTFKDNLRLAVETFSPLGIKTVFEAINTYDMPGFIVHSGAHMLAILDELSHPPGLLMQYDVYHMRRMGEDVEQFIIRHGHQIGHIQFADCPGRRQPGTGSIDFAGLFESIARSAYSGWVGAEYRPAGTTQTSLGWLHQAMHTS
ncbi:MAG: hydroxypyruvate isomerase family protein [Gammaproteobacteria bacterium]